MEWSTDTNRAVGLSLGYGFKVQGVYHTHYGVWVWNLFIGVVWQA